jgi:hypothetical protein
MQLWAEIIKNYDEAVWEEDVRGLKFKMISGCHWVMVIAHPSTRTPANTTN